MSPDRAAGAWKLVTLLALTLCVVGCHRGGSAKKHAASASSSAAGVLHRSSTAAAAAVTGAPVAAGTDTGESDSDDHTQDKSDVSLERLASLPADAQLPAGRWKAGVNYMPLVPSQTTHVAPGRVEVLEVFWLGCPHCYALEPTLQKWLKTKASYVEFVRVPVMWGPMHRAHARLFYTLLALHHEDLVQKAFDAVQRNDPLVANTDEDSLKAQQTFARASGISPDDYAKAYNSAEVAANLERAERLTRLYQVESVPLLVIDGKYTTDVGMAGSAAAVFTLIDDLAASEHSHGTHT